MRLKYVVVAVFQFSRFVERYIDSMKKGFNSDAWLMDEDGKFIYHTRPEMIGKRIEFLEPPGSSMSLKKTILAQSEIRGEYRILDTGGRPVRTIVCQVPLKITARKLWMGMGTAVSSALSHTKQTLFFVILQAFILILVLVVGSASIFIPAKDVCGSRMNLNC